MCDPGARLGDTRGALGERSVLFTSVPTMNLWMSWDISSSTDLQDMESGEHPSLCSPDKAARNTDDVDHTIRSTCCLICGPEHTSSSQSGVPVAGEIPQDKTFEASFDNLVVYGHARGSSLPHAAHDEHRLLLCNLPLSYAAIKNRIHISTMHIKDLTLPAAVVVIHTHLRLLPCTPVCCCLYSEPSQINFFGARVFVRETLSLNVRPPYVLLLTPIWHRLLLCSVSNVLGLTFVTYPPKQFLVMSHGRIDNQ